MFRIIWQTTAHAYLIMIKWIQHLKLYAEQRKRKRNGRWLLAFALIFLEILLSYKLKWNLFGIWSIFGFLFVVVGKVKFNHLKCLNKKFDENGKKRKQRMRIEKKRNVKWIKLWYCCYYSVCWTFERSFKFHQILWMFVCVFELVWFAKLFFSILLCSIFHLNMAMKLIWMFLRGIQSMSKRKEKKREWIKFERGVSRGVCCLCFWLPTLWKPEMFLLKWRKFMCVVIIVDFLDRQPLKILCQWSQNNNKNC